MATENVFGKPMTDGATRDQRATDALNNPNADNKRDQAVDYVRKMKEEWGTGVSTLGIFYNATGENLTFVEENSSYGHIVGLYPTRVQNGQWGAFFHGKTTGAASGSVAFAVYHAKMNDTQFCDMLVGWSTPWDQLIYNNQAYSDIFDDGKVDDPSDVYAKMDQLDSRQCVATKHGMMVSSLIETGTSPLYEAQFTREGAFLLKKSSYPHVAVDA